jgi:hypothetical protein
VRIRQIQRWAKGHNQAMLTYVGAMLRNRSHLPFTQTLDGVLLLGVFAVPLVLIVGWLAALALFYLGAPPDFGPLALLSVASFGTVGNFAAFFQVAAASRLDGSRERIRMLPFLLLGFLVSTLSVARASISRGSWKRGHGMKWDKTERWRGRSDAPAYAAGLARMQGAMGDARGARSAAGYASTRADANGLGTSYPSRVSGTRRPVPPPFLG